jgi:hypothetical protein
MEILERRDPGHIPKPCISFPWCLITNGQKAVRNPFQHIVLEQGDEGDGIILLKCAQELYLLNFCKKEGA